eukprot:CAMPEP_0172681470 /NCGR_PEP_ID=MMETSP1074-20121228/17474_1 /TAXON_ID=2916 /ORGANISM="Ceratium fusus, Strain PA161109" /LENGTH=454 /DNA_ID=CAMNT_0013499981 /DNA_START=332 /DNA_END=1696 /DNA_ORIENTATION=-
MQVIETKVQKNDATSWGSIGVRSTELVNALIGKLMLEKPNSLQVGSMDSIMRGKDTVLSSYTGSGKTLAALVPLAQRLLDMVDRGEVPPQRVVCSPLLLVVTHNDALAMQILSVASKLLTHADELRVLSRWEYSSFGKDPPVSGNRIAKMHEVLLPDVVVETPRQIKALRACSALDYRRLQAVMFDEVDKLFDEEYLSFRELYESLPSIGLQRVLTSASALAHPSIPDLLKTMKPKFNFIDSSFQSRHRHRKELENWEPMDSPPTLKHLAVAVKTEDGEWSSTRADPNQAWRPKVKALINLVQTRKPGDFVMVFVGKANFKAMKESLDKSDVEGLPLNNKRFPSYLIQPDQVLPVLLATDESGCRGLDSAAVSTVINFDLPMGHKNYLHRAGRAGRAGNKGLVISLVSNQKEQRFHRSMLGKVGSPSLYAVDMHGPDQAKKLRVLCKRLLQDDM